jgi:diguanylate cyclase (GGDEF)-like protein
MVDIDHFKTINDTYGHAIGDSVIRTLVDIVNQRLRESDLICRWGGEEFVLCLIETTESDAMIIAEQIRQDVERQVLPVQDERDGRFTVSIGIRVIAPSTPITAGHAVHQAHVALYQAKQLRRNRSEVFSESMQPA